MFFYEKKCISRFSYNESMNEYLFRLSTLYTLDWVKEKEVVEKK